MYERDVLIILNSLQLSLEQGDIQRVNYNTSSENKGCSSITCVLVSAGKIKGGKNITMGFVINRKVTKKKTQVFHHCEW